MVSPFRRMFQPGSSRRGKPAARSTADILQAPRAPADPAESIFASLPPLAVRPNEELQVPVVAAEEPAAAPARPLLTVGDLLPRLPPELIQLQGLAADRAIELPPRVLDAALRSGQAALPLGAVYQACPSLFVQPVAETDPRWVPLPAARLPQLIASAQQAEDGAVPAAPTMVADSAAPPIIPFQPTVPLPSLAPASAPHPEPVQPLPAEAELPPGPLFATAQPPVAAPPGTPALASAPSLRPARLFSSPARPHGWSSAELLGQAPRTVPRAAPRPTTSASPPSLRIDSAGGSSGQILLRALLDCDEDLTLGQALARIGSLPGIAACVCLHTDRQCAHPAQPEPPAAEFIAQAEALSRHLRALAPLIGIAEAETFTLHSGDRRMTFCFPPGAVLAVLHESDAGHGQRDKLTLLARELARLQP